MTRHPIQSSNLHSVGWDEGTLEIAFKGENGEVSSVYRYAGVPLPVYRALMEAPSHGRYFAAHIKGKYPHTKVG